jgi:RsiW-degrading membrane proteinase PrsW (M82 family)
VAEYLRLNFLGPLRHIDLESGLVALLIAAVWVLYLRRIQPTSSPPFPLQALLLLLGAASALLSLTLQDGLRFLLPELPVKGWQGNLAGALVCIGLVEELVKLLPVLLVAGLLRRPAGPLQLVIYGSLSALGFASLENSLYFSQLGFGLVLPRFVFSTVVHMAMTGILLSAWARRLYWKDRAFSASLLFGFSLAAAMHGLFDFFLSAPGRLQLLGYVVLFIAVREYYRAILNCLNFTPASGGGAAEWVPSRPAQNHFSLLFSALFLLSILVYLYGNFHFSTEIANRQLIYTGLLSLPAAFGIFGALGGLRSRPGVYKGLLGWPVQRRDRAAL